VLDDKSRLLLLERDALSALGAEVSCRYPGNDKGKSVRFSRPANPLANMRLAKPRHHEPHLELTVQL